MTRIRKSAIAALSATGAIILLVTLWFLFTGSMVGHAQDLPRAVVAPPANAPVNFDLMSLLNPQEITVNCTLEITTTDRAPTGNNSFLTAASIANYTNQALVSGSVGSVVVANEDYYRLDNAILQTQYTVEAKPDWTTNYNLGIIVYNRDKVPIITDTNTFDNNFATVVLKAENQGPYYFKVFQVSEQCTGHTYKLVLSSVAPTSTPAPTPTSTSQPDQPTPQPTWRSGFDAYEPNYSFERATTLAPGITYNLNFIPWGNATVDNDFFKIRVKPGLQLTCETSDLDPGVDPRMVLYSGPGEAYFVSANDDIELGNFNSRLSFYTSYEGYVYLLVGQGNRMDVRDTVQSNYDLTCKLGVGISVTPGADKAPVPTSSYPTITPQPTATPRPATSPIATPTPPGAERTLSFRLITRPDPPTPTPESSGFRTFRVLVYFDSNFDGQFGAGEGITGFYVSILASDGSGELAQGYTDAQGQLSFTVPTIRTVRLLIPLLGFDRLVEPTQPDVTVRIIPPTLPDSVP